MVVMQRVAEPNFSAHTPQSYVFMNQSDKLGRMTSTNSRLEKYSVAKKQILELLWNGEWVSKRQIYEVTNQTYYDRRLRELREDGWEIEFDSQKAAYRLTSQDSLTSSSNSKRIQDQLSPLVFMDLLES